MENHEKMMIETTILVIFLVDDDVKTLGNIYNKIANGNS